MGRLVGVPAAGVLPEDAEGEICPEEGLQLVDNLVAVGIGEITEVNSFSSRFT